MAISKLPDEWHNLLHTLWSQATDCPGYVKADWLKLESILFRGAEAIAELHANRSSRDE